MIDVDIDVDLVQLVAEEVQEHEVQRSDQFFNANQDKHHNECIWLAEDVPDGIDDSREENAENAE